LSRPVLFTAVENLVLGIGHPAFDKGERIAISIAPVVVSLRSCDYSARLGDGRTVFDAELICLFLRSKMSLV
jgi:hypothetical protein